MVLLRYLGVAAALCYEASAGPCRPRSSTIAAISSDGTGTTTLSTAVEIFTTTASSTTLAASLDNTLTTSTDGTSSESTNPSAPTSTSVAFSSIETMSSYTSTNDAAPATTTLSADTSAGLTPSGTSDHESSTLSETTNADFTTSDDTATSTEASSLTTEEAGTSSSQAASSSQGTSSVTASYQASAGTEASTAETTSSETSTVESTSVKTTSIETTSAQTTTEEATTTSTTIAEPSQPTNYFINGGFEIPNDNGEYNGAPSLLGRSVTIKTDPSNALSDSHYAEFAYPLVGSGPGNYALRQSITGLDPAKRYAYTYNWAPADMVEGGVFNNYLKFTTYIGNGSPYEFEYRGEISPADRYVKRKIVFGGTTATAADFVQTRVQFVGLQSGSVRFDDVSIFEYDPPCTLISPTPSDMWCDRKGSTYSTSNKDKAIGTEQSLSLEDCVQSCHLEPTCQVISYVPTVGNNIGRCWRFKVPREDMEYVQNTGFHHVYEPGCFTFK